MYSGGVRNGIKGKACSRQIIGRLVPSEKQSFIIKMQWKALITLCVLVLVSASPVYDITDAATFTLTNDVQIDKRASFSLAAPTFSITTQPTGALPSSCHPAPLSGSFPAEPSGSFAPPPGHSPCAPAPPEFSGSLPIPPQPSYSVRSILIPANIY